jgi:hypothetical protein
MPAGPIEPIELFLSYARPDGFEPPTTTWFEVDEMI